MNCRTLILFATLLSPSLAFLPSHKRGTLSRTFDSQNTLNVETKRIVSANYRSTGALNMIDTLPFQAIGDAYSNALIQHPIITKGSTGFILCGVGDIIAQVRSFPDTSDSNDANKSNSDPPIIDAEQNFEMDYQRLAKFAAKGVFGTLIWSVWYDYSSIMYTDEGIISALSKVGVNDASEIIIQASRTAMLMLTEQFVACPIVYGLWEIPVPTLLNGGSISSVPKEVKTKLGFMLIENAKVWTLANIFIYNAPVQFRVVMANIGDIFWQSIVSDVAADCGTKQGECVIDEPEMRDDGLDDGFDYIGKKDTSLSTPAKTLREKISN